jgi:hypothetical protein
MQALHAPTVISNFIHIAAKQLGVSNYAPSSFLPIVSELLSDASLHNRCGAIIIENTGEEVTHERV